MRKEKISVNDTVMEIIVKMSEGNPGGMTVVMDMIQRGASIDPDDFMGGLGCVVMLDSLGVYGSRIWCLYKDVCGQSLATTIAIIRSFQLGFVSAEALNFAIDNYGRGIDVQALVKQVSERLPNFKMAA